MTTVEERKLQLLHAIARAKKYGQEQMAKAYEAELRALDSGHE